MDCIVQGITKSWTRLSDFHFTLKGKMVWKYPEGMFWKSVWERGFVVAIFGQCWHGTLSSTFEYPIRSLCKKIK